jgi:hypothetical protein
MFYRNHVSNVHIFSLLFIALRILYIKRRVYTTKDSQFFFLKQIVYIFSFLWRFIYVSRINYFSAALDKVTEEKKMNFVSFSFASCRIFAYYYCINQHLSFMCGIGVSLNTFFFSVCLVFLSDDDLRASCSYSIFPSLLVKKKVTAITLLVI